MYYGLLSQIIKSALVSKRYLWRNGQLSYYNCNFCIFIEMCANSKSFKHLITSTCSQMSIGLTPDFFILEAFKEKLKKKNSCT